MSEVEKAIMQIIAEIMEVDEADMTPDLTMYELGADELDMVEVTLSLEQTLNIQFEDSRMLINPEKKSEFKVADVIKIASDYL